MPTERILRLAFAEEKADSFVLLHIVAESTSPSQIKLTTAASDGEEAFRISIKLDQSSKFRDSKYGGTDDEFGAVLRKTLLLDSQHGSLTQGVEKVEFVAEINKPKNGEKRPHMSLIWRRKVNDWNQKLGQIDLSQYTGQEQPDAFVWAEIAANNFTESRKHVEDLETQLATQAEIIDKLQSQLDSIVNAKDKHEGVLLHKFTELINSKKVKIRGQQRLLGTAKVDPDAVARIAPVTLKSHKAAESRSSKRKANARAEPSDDESSDGFEDAVVKEQEMDVTPQDTGDDTEDEKPAPSPMRTGMRRKIGGRAPVAEREKTKTPEPVTTRWTRGAGKALEKAPEDDLPPPKRELPFARPKPAAPEPKPIKDEDETDDDDEL